VIEKTIRLDANFIIAHEPTVYNHEGATSWLGDDPVLKAKEEVLKRHGIVVWRFHDGIHRHNPDGIRMGVMQAEAVKPKFAKCELFSPGKTNSLVIDEQRVAERMRAGGTEPGVAKVTSEEGREGKAPTERMRARKGEGTKLIDEVRGFRIGYKCRPNKKASPGRLSL
jgi:hypothetical protein